MHVSFQTLIDIFEFSAGRRIGEAYPEEAFPDGGEMLTIERLAEQTVLADRAESVFYSRGTGGAFSGASFGEILSRAETLALALIDLGVAEHDRVGLFADNRLEWLLCDVACLISRAADVPRGTDSTADEIAYIIRHSGARIAFFENAGVLGKVSSRSDLPLETAILWDAKGKETLQVRDGLQVLTLESLMVSGESLRGRLRPALVSRARSVIPDDLFTIIYTSGTTGTPKGVMLTHGNMAYNVTYVPPMIGISSEDVCISLLPVWHVFERAIEYCLLPYGAGLYYSNPRDLREDFLAARPTFMASAPRLWEQIYTGILNKIKKDEPSKRAIFEKSLTMKRRYRRGVDSIRGHVLEADRPTSSTSQSSSFQDMRDAALYYLPAKLADEVVFRKIRAAFGGRLRGTISGGGALPRHVDEFFNLIGVPVYEGYGMTECSPIIAVRPRNKVIQGSVGFLPPGTDVEIRGEAGEVIEPGKTGVIHVRGPQVMKGYYRNEEATDQVLRHGWLNTGDVGFIDKTGALCIRGRSKDTIVLLGGENVEPVPIENALLKSDLIQQVIVVGQDRKTLGALVWPNKEQLAARGMDVGAVDLNEHADAKALFAGTIRTLVSGESGFKAFERVPTFLFLPKALEVGDELTNLYKIKRNVVAQKYAHLIQRLYE